MSDYAVKSTDPTLTDFRFRLDDRLMELVINPSTSSMAVDFFDRSGPGINIWSLGEIRGFIEGLFSYENIMSMMPIEGTDILSRAQIPDRLVARNDACLPPYAGRGADGEYGIEAGVFVFGPVFLSEGETVSEGWDVGRYFWEANAIGMLKCLPGIAADF